MRACIGEPVSWLRLEQYALDELERGDKAAVDAHLSDCTACRSSLSSITDDDWRLPALTPSVQPRRPALLAWLTGSAAVAAVCVVALVLLSRSGGEQAAGVPGPRVSIKGAGTVAVKLVRERDGSTALDPSRYAAGDRFKVLLTCPPGTSLRADAVVFQDREAAFPLTAQTIQCGNGVALQGAFRVTGNTPFTVCAVIGDRAMPVRAALAKRQRAAGLARAACTTVTPVQ